VERHSDFTVWHEPFARPVDELRLIAAAIGSRPNCNSRLIAAIGQAKAQQAQPAVRTKSPKGKQIMKRENNLLTYCAIYSAPINPTRARAHTREMGRKRSMG
jgi:hypothetical protein